jgi:predicted HTH transcriptional regulator
MQISDLTQMVAGGEGTYLEFKRRVPKAPRIAKEMIALANTEGGKLLLGVSDNGSLTGLRDVLEEEFALRRALEQFSMPIVDYSILPVRVPERQRDVLVVDVPESRSKPHFLVNQSNGEETAYVRVADKSVEASTEALELMYADGQEETLHFQFGQKEQVLMRYLDRYERITVGQFARLANISQSSASKTLTHLARINILHLHATESSDFFTLSCDYLS